MASRPQHSGKEFAQKQEAELPEAVDGMQHDADRTSHT